MGGLYESLSGAKGIRAEGKNQQRVSEYQAQVEEQQAKAEEMRSQFDQMQQAKEAERIKSSTVAKIGAAGGSGSPVAIDINLEQAKELELENLLIGYEGMVKSQRHKNQAELDRLQGKLAYQAGKNAARRANIGFGIQLASFAVPMMGGGGNPTGYSGNFASDAASYKGYL